MKKRRTPKRRKANAPKRSRKWLCVFKVDDKVAPRRSPDKPNVRVEAMAVKPGAELDAWVGKSEKAGKLGITQVLYEEMPADNHAGGLLRPYRWPEQQSQVAAALTKLRERLRCRRYAVNGCQNKWRLYVIGLDAAKVPGIKPEHKGAVYVGQTSMTREERAQIHREGKAKSRTGKPLWSKPCHKYYKDPRNDLIPASFAKEYFCESAAKNNETKLMLHLKSLGYKTFGGRDRESRFAAKPDIKQD